MMNRRRSVNLFLLMISLFLIMAGCASVPSIPPTTAKPAQQPVTTPRPTTAGPYVEPGTGLVFPETLGSLVRSRDVTNYGGGGGVKIRYSGPELTAVDVYVYTAGLTGLPDVIDNPEVVKEFDDCKQAILLNRRYGAVQLDDKVTKLREDCRSSDARVSTFALRYEGVDSISYLYLSRYRGHFLKIRATYPRASEALAKDVLNAFLFDLAGLFWNCS